MYKQFDNSKAQCLGKRDKSFAGRIDVKAVEICSAINDLDQFYTTSSCSGRSFLYRGDGIKRKTTEDKSQVSFERWRLAHDLIQESHRYFNLMTLSADPTGGADPVRSIGQFHHAEQVKQQQQPEKEGEDDEIDAPKSNMADSPSPSTAPTDASLIWLRYEPFILHVACRSLAAASALMNAARPAFKNVGLTSWKQHQPSSRNKQAIYYLVAIWGDEGLDLPLCRPSDDPNNSDGVVPLFDTPASQEWLALLVNERHERNWNKLDRFVRAVREMPDIMDMDEEYIVNGNPTNFSNSSPERMPKSFDVVGDVALLYTLPPGDEVERQKVGEAVMKKNKAIKLVAVRTSTLTGAERSPGNEGMTIIAGVRRSPLMTSHMEYGIKCVVDLNHTFFSPRMGPERLRICQQVARGERVLVLFAGVGMEALQIAGRTEASLVLAVEMNPVAVRCARRAHRTLESNKSVKCVGAADRLSIVEGDVLDILPTLEKNSFDRVLAPRPKEGALDGDMGVGDGGVPFLEALLPLLKQDGGECHWYDFAADHEFPECERTRRTIENVCLRQSSSSKPRIINVTKVGSIAKRQLRVCMDFKLCVSSTKV